MASRGGELERRFKLIKDEFPSHGDIVILWYAVYGKKFTRAIIMRAWNILIAKDQYDIRDKADLVDYIVEASWGDKLPYRITSKGTLLK